MFFQIFYRLKMRKVPVSTTELLDFLKVVQYISDTKGFSNLKELYLVGRSSLIKDIKYFDDYDLIFSEVFSTLKINDEEFRNLLNQWLSEISKSTLDEDRKKDAMNLSTEDLFKELEKRINEQKEKHNGGNYWIGTGGTSAFGNSGFNPNGVKIGENPGMKLAIDVLNERKYREYRTDERLNVRQIKIALKNLKDLRKEGRKEFHLEETILKTCENGGDPEIVFQASRKNKLKLMLLMDVGGSMTPHAERVSKLFSAAHQMNHFKEFHYYYFHNIVYNKVYETASFQKSISLNRLFKKISRDTKVIFVGDASMNPYELFGVAGRYFQSTLYQNQDKELSGIDSLKKLLDFYTDSVWINPEPQSYWDIGTCSAIWELVPMYFLSVDGLKKAINSLIK
jgi:uncharacterized protein